jgi:uncharacterized membrane protein YtjA (UPF0391 family)
VPAVCRRQRAICSSENLKFRGFVARNLRFRDGLFPQVTARRPIAPVETESRGFAMLGWVVTFLIIALIAGVLGFGGIAGVSIEIAKAIFFIAIILFLVSAVVGLVRGRSRV